MYSTNYSNHAFIPIDRFFKNFKELGLSETNPQLSFEFSEKFCGVEEFNRVGYAQYVLDFIPNSYIFAVKYRKEDDSICHINCDTKVKAKKVFKIEQFKDLKGYKDIEIVFTLKDNEMNVVDFKHPMLSMPSGKYKLDVIGFLVKEKEKKKR